MPTLNEPEKTPVEAIEAALSRLVNELPTIAAGIVAVLYVFGTDVAEADVSAVLDHAEAVVGFGLWLFIRSRTDGPVTRAQAKPTVLGVHPSGQQVGAEDLPTFTHHDDGNDDG